jgi:amino acid transporter
MNNKEALHGIPYVRRWDRNKSTDDYPYRGHGQPITAYASLLGCLLILFVANGASLWKEFRIQQFLAAYLAVSCTVNHSRVLLMAAAYLFSSSLAGVETPAG